ncbi:MAG: response regulator [Candidatus Nitrosotenuis sp.]
MKVLIIDDNKPLVETIVSFLAIKNIQCKAITNGKEGLDAIMKETFDFVLLDLNMPGFSGFNIYSFLKAHNNLKSSHVIVITGQRLFDKDVREMMLAGVKRIIKKPFSLNDLYDEFRQLSMYQRAS